MSEDLNEDRFRLYGFVRTACAVWSTDLIMRDKGMMGP